MSATKQAFLDMANSPIINLEEYEDCANFDESAQEILLSDSDDEDEDHIQMLNEQEEDMRTSIDSDDLNNMFIEEDMDAIDVFEESDSQNVIFQSDELKATKNILKFNRQNWHILDWASKTSTTA